MEWYWALLILIGGAVFLMFLGLPVAFAFFGANIVGALLFLGGVSGFVQVARNVVDAVASFTLAPLVMFILMGEILFHSGVAIRAIDAVERLVAKIPGRLALAAVGGGVVFSALSGSQMANTALLGSTLIPEMQRRGYHPSISMGPIMAVGGVAMLIPPSNMAVLLGTISNIPISYLLIGGIIPGLMIGLGHAGFVLIRCVMNPGLAPVYELPQMTLWERVRPFLVYVAPTLTLFVVVVGSIFAGIATPTESAALGAVGAAICAAGYRSLDLKVLDRSLRETAKIAAMMLFIIAGSTTFTQILAFSGATRHLVSLVSQVNPEPLVVLLTMLGILLLLGTIMDSISMMLLTVPFYMPIAQALGIDTVWLGVLMLFAIEISGMTPPFGMVLFAMKGVAPPGTTMKMIYNAVTPFIIIELLLLCAIIAVPDLATFLPSLLKSQ